MYMTDEELLAKNYGFWGNARKDFMYNYRTAEWGFMQETENLDRYLTKFNDRITRKEHKMLDKALLRSGLMASIRTMDKNEWVSRCMRVRESLRKLLLKEMVYEIDLWQW